MRLGLEDRTLEVRSNTMIPTTVRSNNIRIMTIPSTAASVVAESSAQNSQIRVEMTTLFDVLNILSLIHI